MGVTGWVAAPANIVARQCVQLYELAVEQKNLPAARALYERLLPLFALFEESGQYVQLNKAALSMLGRPAGQPRPPLLPPSDTLLAKLKECIQTIDLAE
jgi:4-hydroxy-tetrahydrodipicolinate synthase